MLVCVLGDGLSHLGCECCEGRGSVSVYSLIHTQRLGHSEFSMSICWVNRISKGGTLRRGQF